MQWRGRAVPDHLEQQTEHPFQEVLTGPPPSVDTATAAVSDCQTVSETIFENAFGQACSSEQAGCAQAFNPNQACVTVAVEW